MFKLPFISREQHFQRSIDLVEECLAEALAFEAKGNHARAAKCLAQAEHFEAKAFDRLPIES